MQFKVDGKAVGVAKQGKSFGELALLYTCPRAATVVALEDTELFRVDQKAFRFILQAKTKEHEKAKRDLLQKIPFLKDISPQDVDKIADNMQVRRFTKNEVVMKKGEIGEDFMVVQQGQLLATDLGSGDKKYEDVKIRPGDSFGERALVTGEPRVGNIIAQTDGTAFSIDKKTFESVLGSFNGLMMKSMDQTRIVSDEVLNVKCPIYLC